MLVRTWHATVLVGCLFLCSTVFPSLSHAQDIAYTEHVDLFLEEKAGGYSLRSEVRETFTLMSERSTDLSTWRVAEHFYEDVRRLKVHVGGEAVDTDQIQYHQLESRNAFLTGTNAYTITLPRDMKVGTGVSISYEKTYDAPQYAPILQVPNLSGTVALVVNVHHPADVEVGSEVVVMDDSTRMESERLSPTRLQFVLDKLQPRPDRPFEILPQRRAAMMVSLKDASGWITPSRPAAFAGWYESLLPTGGAVPDSVVTDLVDGAATQSDTVAALYDRMRSEVRYLLNAKGTGAIVPRTPRAVLDTGYGDCKDKAYFIHRTAQALGIDVRMALLAVGPKPEFDAPHPASFDHVVNAWKVGGEWRFFDPTHEHVPFGNVPASDVGQRALVLDGEASEFVTISAPNEAPDISLVLDASTDALDRASAQITVRNHAYAAVREILDTETGLRRENELVSVFGPWLYKMQVGSLLVIDDGEHTITLHADANLSDFLIASPTRLYVPMTALRVAEPAVLERRTDAMPIRFPSQPSIDATLRLRAPGHTVTPDSLVLDGDSASFTARVEDRSADAESGEPSNRDAADALGDRTVFSYQFRPPKRILDGEARAGFLDFTDSLLDAKRKMFVLKPVDTSVESDADSPPNPDTQTDSQDDTQTDSNSADE